MSTIVPARHQRPLPLDQIIRRDPPGAEAIEMDVVIVGAGPAGLACAIELTRLAKQDAESGGGLGELNIAVLEKAGALGEHNLSGAVVNPRTFHELFPDLNSSDIPFRQPVAGEAVYFMTEGRAQRIPTPPTMHNAGFYTASICEIVRWMGERAEQAGVNLFTGFPVDALLVEGDAVRGVRTTPSGLDRDRQPTADYGEPTDVTAKVTVIAEGTRGLLSQGWCEWQQVRSPNPQIFALGVKEVWQTPKPLNAVIHTLGWPLPDDAFGGSFMYPLGPGQIALGLVVGLDYHDASLDVHELLQRMKLHPLFRPYLEGGELLEWGAKTIPEGGYHALLERRSGDGILLVGDAVGLVDVPSLKGIHYAMQSGIYAARAAFAGLKQGDLSAARLSAYDRLVDESYIVADMYRTRNMRLAFKDGLYVGGFKAGLMTISGGRLFGGRMEMPEDATTPRRVTEAEPFTPDGKLTFGKLDAVFKSGNATRDTIPSHLLVGPDVSAQVAEFYSHVCPAGVYERVGDELRVNAPNCIDCKATDVLGPRWTPREGGSGP
ncbi:MAG TPA: electron-transfer flavoprotein:ubiquinone oxidoreductase, partial [Gemmatimonadales bacterium]|nr:electron-transfer flavoprotein:ubiquinone oxidoreductase [Gemmatimonadales bacterium]